MAGHNFRRSNGYRVCRTRFLVRPEAGVDSAANRVDHIANGRGDGEWDDNGYGECVIDDRDCRRAISGGRRKLWCGGHDGAVLAFAEYDDVDERRAHTDGNRDVYS
jgi:hypothetical protein